MEKRFRVIDIEEQKVFGHYDTIKGVVIALGKKWKSNRSTDDYMIEDLVEDIEVNWAELMEAWDNGERPEDLQMF